MPARLPFRPSLATNETILVEGLTNTEFFERYASPGRIGVVGGTHWTDQMIFRAQRHQHPERKWSDWSHVFIFQGRRLNGKHWVIESDMAFREKHIRLGAQENRIEKYCDEKRHQSVMVIDLGLDAKQVKTLLAHALEYVANGARYSIRELIGTAWALHNPVRRTKANILARDQAFYCSAFVRHLFSQVGCELAPDVTEKKHDPGGCGAGAGAAEMDDGPGRRNGGETLDFGLQTSKTSDLLTQQERPNRRRRIRA